MIVASLRWAIAAAGLALVGCHGPPASTADVDTGLTRLTANKPAVVGAEAITPPPPPEAASSDPWAQQALDLERILSERASADQSTGPGEPDAAHETAESGSPAESATRPHRGFGRDVGPGGAASEADSAAPAKDEIPAAPSTVTASPSETDAEAVQSPTDSESEPSASVIEAIAPAPTLEQRLSEAVDELERLVGERLDSAVEPLASWRALQLALRAVRGEPIPESKPDPSLTPTQGRALRIVSEILRILDDAETGDLGERLAGISRDLEAARPLRISRAVLCTSVRGYGQYAPFATSAFLAGRAQRVVVYVELEGFTFARGDSTPASDAETGGWTIDVSQELQLLRDPDLQVYRQPPQIVRHRSRNRVRDFYLVDVLDLPATLSVGRYSLKVIVRDRNSGASDEANIPIRVVAQESLTMDRP